MAGARNDWTTNSSASSTQELSLFSLASTNKKGMSPNSPKENPLTDAQIAALLGQATQEKPVINSPGK